MTSDLDRVRFDFVFDFPGWHSDVDPADREVIEEARDRGDDYVAVAAGLGYPLHKVTCPDGYRRWSLAKND